MFIMVNSPTSKPQNATNTSRFPGFSCLRNRSRKAPSCRKYDPPDCFAFHDWFFAEYSLGSLFAKEGETSSYVETADDVGKNIFLFGRRFHPIDHVYKQHKGTDMGGRRFSGTAIVAARDGVVLRSGNGGGVTTFYGHMKPGVAQRGKKVRAGQPIGRMGSTGKSTGDYLHFEVRIHGKSMDPLKYY